jgi:predicted Zn-dependent protease
MRRLLVLAAVVANVTGVGAAFGPQAAAALALGWLLLFAFVIVVLPRAAHAAFVAGDPAAARRYRLLARISLAPARRAAAWVSVAACHLAAGSFRHGADILDAIDADLLDGPSQAAWLNNRAYAVLRGQLGDPGEALTWAERAIAARPDVPGLVHTHGVALLAVGRLDDAIRAFDSMWSAGDLQPRLEAERCLDLARAWELKGHPDYAADYRARAARSQGGAAATRAVLGFDDDGP